MIVPENGTKNASRDFYKYVLQPSFNKKIKEEL
jgi:hypothetical protein